MYKIGIVANEDIINGLLVYIERFSLRVNSTVFFKQGLNSIVNIFVNVAETSQMLEWKFRSSMRRVSKIKNIHIRRRIKAHTFKLSRLSLSLSSCAPTHILRLKMVYPPISHFIFTSILIKVHKFEGYPVINFRNDQRLFCTCAT